MKPEFTAPPIRFEVTMGDTSAGPVINVAGARLEQTGPVPLETTEIFIMMQRATELYLRSLGPAKPKVVAAASVPVVA